MTNPLPLQRYVDAWRMSNHRLQYVVACVLLAAAPARAQQLIRKHGYGCGFGVTGLRNIDGDGVGDYAFADYHSPGVLVRSGKSGASLFKIDAPPNVADFGTSLADGGDIDGDGIEDLVIGADWSSDPSLTKTQCGAVFACSGADGHVLQSAYGSATNDLLGCAVAGVGDVDGDGFADFVAGAVQDNLGTVVGNGYLRCYSGKTGAVLFQLDGSQFGDDFGKGVAALSDHDGDGVRDLAVVSWWDTRVCSGASGATLATIPCPTYSNWGGVCEVDDLDGDGALELAVGETGAVFALDGQVSVFSIPTQVELRVNVGTDYQGLFGFSAATIGDADGDGVRDYLIGEEKLIWSKGSASLFSGRTGERLYRFVDAYANGFMGIAVADAGDLDGDGRSEMLVGSPYSNDGVDNGAVFLFGGNDLWLNAEPKSVPAGKLESIETHGAPAGNPVATFLVDVSGTPLFQLLAIGTSDAVESFVLQGTGPPGLAGITITLRSYAVNAGGRLMTSADETVQFL